MFNRDPETRQELHQTYKAALAIGILMIIMGALAILYPLFATIFTFNVIGFVLLLFGILQLAYAYQTRHNPVGHPILNILTGIFYLAVGFWVLRHPVFSILDLTLVIGILFFIEGAIQVINAFELHPTQNRGLLLASGIIGIILGILIWSNWPFDSLTLLGLFVGINLITTGVSLLLFFRAAKQSLAGEEVNRVVES
ncbi:HdeD family acid-resistance protein [Synechocystis sp. FACHB-383]|uniref:HdeD family acid-resistance protein n=1 Tax=Synechocystis sp. FACHB-383 TaxID=2692864 RepID=UPI001685645C|nr:HdeD family acid-resistance protein [Synechocystis sp. FACHB-383]MBD2655156.1 HdeD family acid-resistance protein [Synechocystis sp. FACHB-383]